MGDLWAILFAVFLLALNAFFVGVEFSLISARRHRLEEAAVSSRSAGSTAHHHTRWLKR